MAQAAQDETKQIEEVSKITNEMSTGVSQTATVAGNVAEKSRAAATISEEGGKSAQEGVNMMNNIQEAVNNSAATVKSLGEKSSQIGGIVKTITDIS